jgi:hypothetical protein
LQSISYVPFSGTGAIQRGWFVKRSGNTPLGELTQAKDGTISFRPEGRSLSTGELAGLVHFIQAVKNAG